MMKLFSYKDRPVHLGPFPLETLTRTADLPDLLQAPPMQALDFSLHDAHSIAHPIARYMAMLDILRNGVVAHDKADIPDDPVERANHLKAAGYFFDASMVGACELNSDHFLDSPILNPTSSELVAEFEQGPPKEAPPEFEMVHPRLMAMGGAPHTEVNHHTHALVFLVEYTRDPNPEEPGAEWLMDTQAERAGLLTANTAMLMAEYIRLLGYDARAHTATASDVDLNRLAVSGGLATPIETDNGFELINPFVGTRFGLAAVTTKLSFAADAPLGANAGRAGLKSHGPKWWLGIGQERRASNAAPFKDREFYKGPHPFEKLKRKETPTTLIDEERVPRFPKRADWFARALFGDLGKRVQDTAKGFHFIKKSPIGACALSALSSLIALQYGESRGEVSPSTQDPKRNAENIKAAAYYLSTDAVGLSSLPDWVYYSHGSKGLPVTPYHTNGISMVIDQGHETMEGASGDDWVSVAQSIRAYLRFSVLGGVIAEQIRRQGYSARVHTAIDGEVLQPPLLLLSGLGEVSRIGDVILNPFLGPRLKSGVVTTSMPMEHDKPIDFGLQNFCDNCLKCARECPSGAITAGPKVMYNGYETWRSDAEKCTRYRITNDAGAMCGRCMKMCPWNLEGLFSDSAFRWLATNAPTSAKTLAKLDDALGRGIINPVKKWWWDIELGEQGDRYVRAKKINVRELTADLDLRYEDQTLAAYPADMTPTPLPIPQPVDREAGIARYQALMSPASYKQKLSRGETDDLVPSPEPLLEAPPVFPVRLAKRTDLSEDIVKFEFASMSGDPLPPFEAGAHLDVVIAPEYQRQYSLAGDPRDSSKYVLGVQREKQGRGGSMLMHAAFQEGRIVFVSPPRNHFPLDEMADFSVLMAGGIGITPMITMAHRLHALGREFILHFSAASEAQCGFAEELKAAPWGDRVFFHFSKEGGRADLDELIPTYREGFKLYTCGSDRYMNGIFDAATAKAWPDEALSREYFSAPELPEYDNYPFELELIKSKRVINVPADKTATEALEEAGIKVNTKCSDGICGVCAVRHFSDEIEHRDFVLSEKERQDKIVLCCSRAKVEGDTIAVEL